jgi:hypothetical protein
MLIALLAVLGVNLWVLVVLLAVLLARRRWAIRQPGAFKGAVRVVEGDVPGLRSKWKRGYGRWVRDILVWTKAPFHFRNELIAADFLAGQARTGKPAEVKRLGKCPAIVLLAVQGASRIEVAASAGGREQALGPFAAGAPARRCPGTTRSNLT